MKARVYDTPMPCDGQFGVLKVAIEDDFTKKYAGNKSAWRRQSLLPGYSESKVYLPHEIHEKLTRLASQSGMRMPFLLGYCVEEYLEMRETGKVETPRIQIKDSGGDIPPEMFKLFNMIYSSRFPDDTGSARFRYVAILVAILTEKSAGIKPTIRNIARRSNTHDSQLNLMVKTLVERGILTRTLTPGAVPARSAKVLEIAPDAIQKLEETHLAMVGTSLLGEAPE